MPNRPLQNEPLFTPQEAAHRLSMSVKTLKRHVAEGRLRFINIGTQQRKVFRFTEYNLTTFIENQKVRETPSCQSSNTPKAPSTKSNFGSTVIPFEALQKPATKKKQKP